tara:strand:+ start:14484 stop:15404 length:921 start_codon:yes stop_codon:yes gene_type:complete
MNTGLRCVLIISCFLLFASCKSTQKIYSPVDSYVCVESDQNSCPDSLIPKEWEEGLTSRIEKITGQNSVVIPILRWDEKISERRSKKSGNNEGNAFYLDYDKIKSGYCPIIEEYIPLSYGENESQSDARLKMYVIKRESQCVKFYSPLVLGEYIDSLRQLNFAIKSCNRISKAISDQKEILDIQKNSVLEASRAELLRVNALQHDASISKSIPEPQLEQLYQATQSKLNSAEKIRRILSKFKIDYEFYSKLESTQLDIETIYEDLLENLFYLKELSGASCDIENVESIVPNNSWVAKGIPVVEVKK